MKKSSAQRPLSHTETAAFCSQMSMILKAGISPGEGLSIMALDSRSQDEKRLLSLMEEHLLEHGSFFLALKAAGIFPDYMLHMIDIREQAGRLDEVMESLSLHYEREAGIASSIKNAVIYPFVMILMMIAVILILIVKVLPVFEQVFKQLGREAGGLSGTILTFGTTLNRYSIVLTALFSLAALAFLLLFYTKRGRAFASRLAVRTGLFSGFRQKTAVCRFASAMSLTLSSGLDLEQCLDLASPLIDDASFRKKLDSCRSRIQEGAELSEALTQAGIFSGAYARLLRIGTHTGSTEQVLKDISVRCEEEADAQINRSISILEPTLVAVLSIVVGIILLSVMLPLIGIINGF